MIAEISAEEFLAWAAAGRIGPDLRYAEPRCLVFQGVEADSRFWALPDEEAARTAFAGALVDLLGVETGITLWPRCGHWEAFADYPDEIPAALPLRETILQGRAVAVRFTDGDKAALVEFVCFIAAVGGAVGQDVFLIPDDRSHLVQTDHHGVVHIVATDPSRLAAAIDFLAVRGFHLPTDVPDWTFKRPQWM